MRKQKKTQYYQNAGALVAQGSYGCVYRPPLPCGGDDRGYDTTGKVSKLMNKEEAIKELEEYDIIEDIDPEHKFHLQKPKLCTLGVEIDNTTQYDTCRVIQRAKQEIPNVRELTNEMRLLQNEDGGMSMTQYIKHNLELLKTKRGLYDFFKGLQPLFYGLKVMYENNVCHFDIKMDNIVVNSEVKSLYIDFGLSFRFDESFTMENIDYILENGYFAHPIELILVSGEFQQYITKLTKKNVTMHHIKRLRRTLNTIYKDNYKSDMLNRLIDHSEPSKVEQITLLNNLEENDSLNEYDSYMIDNYLTKLYKVSLDKLEINMEMVKEMIMKVDVYSLGIVLLDILVNITGKKFKPKMNAIKAKEYYNNDYHFKLYYLVNQMIKGNFNDRYNGDQAFAHYVSLQPFFESILHGGNKKKTQKKRHIYIKDKKKKSNRKTRYKKKKGRKNQKKRHTRKN